MSRSWQWPTFDRPRRASRCSNFASSCSTSNPWFGDACWCRAASGCRRCMRCSRAAMGQTNRPDAGRPQDARSLDRQTFRWVGSRPRARQRRAPANPVGELDPELSCERHLYRYTRARGNRDVLPSPDPDGPSTGRDDPIGPRDKGENQSSRDLRVRVRAPITVGRDPFARPRSSRLRPSDAARTSGHARSHPEDRGDLASSGGVRGLYCS